MKKTLCVPKYKKNTMRKIHFHGSDLNKVLKCPLCYFLLYVNGYKIINSCQVLTKEGPVQGETPSVLALQDILEAALGWGPSHMKAGRWWPQKRQKSHWS